MAGTNIMKIAKTFGVSRSTDSKAFTIFEKMGQSSSSKQSFGRKTKISDLNRRSLTRIVRKHIKTQLPKLMQILMKTS